MAPSFKPGKRAFMKLAKTGSTMIMSSGVDGSDLQRQADTYDVTTYGRDDKVFIPGLRFASLKWTGPYASTYEQYLATMLGATGYTASYGPTTTAANQPKFTAGVILTNIDISAPVGGRVQYSADTIITGAVTSTHF